MFNRRVVLRACGAFLGLAIAAGTVTSLSASVRSNRTEYLTFSGPVSLPGVALQSGHVHVRSGQLRSVGGHRSGAQSSD